MLRMGLGIISFTLFFVSALLGHELKAETTTYYIQQFDYVDPYILGVFTEGVVITGIIVGITGLATCFIVFIIKHQDDGHRHDTHSNPTIEFPQEPTGDDSHPIRPAA